MSDRENPPTDLFDAVCRLADWLEDEYPDEASRLRDLSLELKGCIIITAGFGFLEGEP